MLRISAQADGGPFSRVCARETLCLAPHQHEWKFSGARVCRVTFNQKSYPKFHNPTQGHPRVLPSCVPRLVPSSVIGSTLTLIVRGPGSVPGWGLSNAVPFAHCLTVPVALTIARGVFSSDPSLLSFFLVLFSLSALSPSPYPLFHFVSPQ